MAQVLRFFPQQAMSGLGNGAGTVDIYSEIFDVSDYKQLDAELIVHSLNPSTTGITGMIQTNANPNLAEGWKSLTPVYTGLAESSQSSTVTGLLRFVRAKITVPEQGTAMISLEGVAKK